MTEQVVSCDLAANDHRSESVDREHRPGLAGSGIDFPQVDRTGVLGDQSLDDVLVVMDGTGPERMVGDFGFTDAPAFRVEVEGDAVVAAEEVVE